METSRLESSTPDLRRSGRRSGFLAHGSWLMAHGSWRLHMSNRPFIQWAVLLTHARIACSTTCA